jgi:hypothetical protein
LIEFVSLSILSHRLNIRPRGVQVARQLSARRIGPQAVVRTLRLPSWFCRIRRISRY